MSRRHRASKRARRQARAEAKRTAKRLAGEPIGEVYCASCEKRLKTLPYRYGIWYRRCFNQRIYNDRVFRFAWKVVNSQLPTLDPKPSNQEQSCPHS